MSSKPVLTLGETMGLLRATGIGSLEHVSSFELHIGGAESNVAIGLVQRHIPYEILRGNKAANYDPFRFNWLGSVASEVSVTTVWSTAPHRTGRDLLTVPIIAGSLGPETDSEIESNAMIRLLGAPIQLVRGYTGTAGTRSLLLIARA